MTPEERNPVADYNTSTTLPTWKAVCIYGPCAPPYEKLPKGANGLGKYNNRLSGIDIGISSTVLGKILEENSCPTMPTANISTVAHCYNGPSKVLTTSVINVYCSGVNEVFFVTTLLPPGS